MITMYVQKARDRILAHETNPKLAQIAAIVADDPKLLWLVTMWSIELRNFLNGNIGQMTDLGPQSMNRDK